LLAAVVVEPLAVTMDLAAVVQVVCLPAHSPLQLLVTRLPLERAELLLPQRQEVTTQQILMVQIRQSRLASIGQEAVSDYIDIESIKAEVAESRKLFAKLNCSIIDVTKRSVEGCRYF
jgi:hypothetical protein